MFFVHLTDPTRGGIRHAAVSQEPSFILRLRTRSGISTGIRGTLFPATLSRHSLSRFPTYHRRAPGIPRSGLASRCLSGRLSLNGRVARDLSKVTRRLISKLDRTLSTRVAHAKNRQRAGSTKSLHISCLLPMLVNPKYVVVNLSCTLLIDMR